ncbi:MAG: hypothetical protein ACI4W6_05445 [Acutalibacteraceae bacterium]
MVAKVFKEPHYTYIDEEKSKQTGMPYYINTELAFYDILINITQLHRKEEAFDEDPYCSICSMSLTPEMNWVRTDDESEARIIAEMKTAFEKVCYRPLFENKKDHFSLYEYVVRMFKIQNIYPDIPHMLKFADLAFEFHRYGDALVWLKRIVFDFYMNGKTLKYDFSDEEKEFLKDHAFISRMDQIMNQDFDFGNMHDDIEEYIKEIYFKVRSKI